MVLMALDHANHFVAQQHSPGEYWGGSFPVYHSTLAFLTRLVTHLSAPGFFFLMGVGMVLFAHSRRKRGWGEGAIVRQFLAGWEPQEDPPATRNEKSLLLELAQAKGLRPRYHLIFEGGPEHRKVFAVRVFLGRRVIGHGWGFRKKDAERMAAREALKALDS